MNFVLTIIFVISTVGIYSVNANDPWTPEYMDRFGFYYSSFIAKMASFAIAAFPQSSNEIIGILSDYNSHVGNAKKFPQLGLNDHEGFSNLTRPAIQSVLNSLTPNTDNGIEILGKIMTLCQDVNGDNTILLRHKFDNLPVRDVLLAYFVNYGYGSEEDFDTKYCHINSESFANFRENTMQAVTEWDRINVHFHNFFNDVTLQALNSYQPNQYVNVEIRENLKDYVNEVLAVRTLPNNTYKTDDGCTNCIKSKLEFLFNNGFPQGSDVSRVFVSIAELCRTINGDNAIGDGYKYTNLPARQVLKDFYMSRGGTGNHFDQICRVVSPEDTFRKSGEQRRKYKGKLTAGEQQESLQRR